MPSLAEQRTPSNLHTMHNIGRSQKRHEEPRQINRRGNSGNPFAKLRSRVLVASLPWSVGSVLRANITNLCTPVLVRRRELANSIGSRARRPLLLIAKLSDSHQETLIAGSLQVLFFQYFAKTPVRFVVVKVGTACAASLLESIPTERGQPAFPNETGCDVRPVLVPLHPAPDKRKIEVGNRSMAGNKSALSGV
jgi:hypothetical protein